MSPKDEKLAYEKDMLLKLDIENSKREAVEKAAQESFAKGKAEGKAEGLAEGKAEGKAEGLAEGEIKGEAKAQLEIARKMKTMALSAEQIATATGLSVDDILSL